jgi:hypothetical protein
MKIGDWVVWHTTLPSESRGGIIVDGPRKGTSGDLVEPRYAVAWFEAQETMWHLGVYLKVVSENR